MSNQHLSSRGCTTLNWRSGLALVLITFSGSGATCGSRMQNPFAGGGPPAPNVLQPTPSAADIVAAVNANTSRVTSYSAPSGSISIPGMPNLPLLESTVSVERPKRFRLRASLPFMGPEVDMGSNDQLFWFWANRAEPPALYFARHDQYANSAARQLMPVEPEWIIEALGLVTLDPAADWQGPTPLADGTLELRSSKPGPNGPVERVVVVDATRAWVIRQYVYDSQSNLIASAEAESFRYDPITQVSLPEQVTLNLPASGLALTINLGTVSINRLAGDPAQLWAMPDLGEQKIDLGRSDGLPTPNGALSISPNTPPPAFQPQHGAIQAGLQQNLPTQGAFGSAPVIAATSPPAGVATISGAAPPTTPAGANPPVPSPYSKWKQGVKETPPAMGRLPANGVALPPSVNL